MTLRDLSRFSIPIAPYREQEHIAAEVERRFSILDEVQTEVEANLKRAVRLRRSILKQAFEGKLVPQDPNDEPALTLLARVREEKARREQEARQAQRLRRRSPQRTQEGQDMKNQAQRRPLQEVLFEVDEPLKPEELFSKAGFEPESAEDFYVELREEVRNNRVEELRPNSTDVYLRPIKE